MKIKSLKLSLIALALLPIATLHGLTGEEFLKKAEAQLEAQFESLGMDYQKYKAIKEKAYYHYINKGLTPEAAEKAAGDFAFAECFKNRS